MRTAQKLLILSACKSLHVEKLSCLYMSFDKNEHNFCKILPYTNFLSRELHF